MSRAIRAIREPFKWYGIALRHYASFEGRARRREFWWFLLVNVVVGTLATVADHLLRTPGTALLGWWGTAWFDAGGMINHLYGLATLVPTLAVTWRRMHDCDRAGPVALVAPLGAALFVLLTLFVDIFIGIVLAPVVTLLIITALAAGDGTHGPNRFGPDPKRRLPLPGVGPAVAERVAGTPPATP